MVLVLDAYTSLQSDTQEQEVNEILKSGKTGKTLLRTYYHTLETYDLFSLGWG